MEGGNKHYLEEKSLKENKRMKITLRWKFRKFQNTFKNKEPGQENKVNSRKFSIFTFYFPRLYCSLRFSVLQLK